MREIKFRGKPLDYNVDGAFNWVYGDLVRELDTGRTFILDLSHHGPSTTLDDVMIEVIPESVGQYTGLKDKKEKEIYEDDIVRVKHPRALRGGDFYNSIGRVFWSEDSWYHGNDCGRPPKRMWEYCEVIGNKSDNSELLK